ncbi:DPP IV N-terminal domain-containing protein [Acidobacteriota bacterium]
MTKRYTCLFILMILYALLCSSPIQAEITTQTEREAMYDKYLKFPSYVKGGTVSPHWMGDGNSFWYAEGAPENTVIYKVDPEANSRVPLFDVERLRKALTPLLGHEPPHKGLPFADFTFTRENTVQFSAENKLFMCQFDSYDMKLVPPPSPEEKARFTPKRFFREGHLLPRRMSGIDVLSPGRRWFATIKDYNLWLRSTDNGRNEQITTCGTQGFEWDVEGIKWKPWSPDGQKIAVFKHDYRKVFKAPVVHRLKTNEEIEWMYVVKSDGPLRRAELYIVDILSKKQVRVDVGDETDKYFTIVGWLPDGSELIFARFDRTFKKVELMAADPKTGTVRIILNESQPTFIRIQHAVVYYNRVGCTLLSDGQRFIWMSERDGWNHLYLYDLNGKLIRRLTEGNFPVLDVTTLDETEGWIYFTAHAEERVYDTHLYRINFEGQGFMRLTEAPGQHSARGNIFSPSKKFFIDQHSSVDRPPSAEVRKTDGTLLQVLSKANIDGLKDLKWSAPEEFVAKAADQKTDLHGVLYKPFDFDPNKKYPVIESIYGGPQGANVPRIFLGGSGFPNRYYPLALAQLGYIVFVVDGRGTPGRSKAFQDVVYGSFGRHEIPDHLAVLKQLCAERPYMDLGRVGICGYSWGGTFTVRALTLAPDVYKVGVAGAGGYDFYSLNMYEPYLDMPKDNKEAYDYGSSLWLADKLVGKVLFIVGTDDLAMSDTYKMIDALIKAGKPYDLILLPEQSHGIFGVSATYYVEAVKRYFCTHLPPNNR